MERERERWLDIDVWKKLWVGYVFVRIGYGAGEVVNGG